MTFAITVTPEAREDFGDLTARDQAEVRDAINTHLRFQPTRANKSRIKRLRELEHPQYRLRVGDIRVFYDVVGDEVVILGILDKSATTAWLKKWSV
jgi:mRNA-degrading endonuclease RelE of RelBE toxin-antitoxin system